MQLVVDNFGIISHSNKNHSKVQRGLIHKSYIYLKGKLKEFPLVEMYWTNGLNNPADIGNSGWSGGDLKTDSSVGGDLKQLINIS